MPVEIVMPALSPTMEKGTLARWLVAEGDQVNVGDILAEIETDKATMELEAEDSGQIAKLLLGGGSEDVAVGTAIALMARDGEVVASAPAEPKEGDQDSQEAGTVHPTAASTDLAVARNTVEEMDGRTAEVRTDDDVYASPLARRIAGIREIALSSIKGSGPRGKIVKADLGFSSILRGSETPPEAISTFVPDQIMPPDGVPVETLRLSSMRKTIARRLTLSKQSVPHFYLTARCNLDPLLALRSTLNESLVEQGIKLSVNDFLIKALAQALIRVPEANVQFGGDVLHQFARVDVSMAVAIEGGLVTPVLNNADTKSLSAIAQEAKALAAKAREGNLVPEDYLGGTASLSNLGMFGIDEMIPVINPPQALILGVGAAIRQPWNVDDDIGLATILTLTASFDHRAIDGAVAARLMGVLKSLLQEPIRLLA